MGVNVFISFRFSDGERYKDNLIKHFDNDREIYNRSEDTDRSHQSESTIREFLYNKLKYTSLTIVILTPNALNYSKNSQGEYKDWLYDELKYSLEDREQNKTNAIIALYTQDVVDQLFYKTEHVCSNCNKRKTVNTVLNFDNLVRKNMMNIKEIHKKNNCENLYDSNYDSYISLISFEEFKENTQKYIDIALEKKENIHLYELVKKM